MNSQQHLINWLENTVKLNIVDYTTPEQFKAKVRELIESNITPLKTTLPANVYEVIRNDTALYLRLLDTNSIYYYLKRKNSPNVLVRLLNKLFN